jgi:transposase
MERHLLMSQKERTRLGVMKQVKAKQLSLVAAAQLMDVSYRQAKRVWRRYQDKGDAGLVHVGRGQAGNRRTDGRTRERILVGYQERYPDFGPTLAAEHLSREGLKVDHETLRRWLLARGLWTVKRRRQKHRQWRERKACFGELVQMDGSHHDWFEGRRRGRWFQIASDHQNLCLVGRSVTVRQLRDGVIQVLHEGSKLKCHELAQRPKRAPKPKMLQTAIAQSQPATDHPWRQFGTGVGKEFWRGVKARARAARQRSWGLRSASASLRPPSGPRSAATKAVSGSNKPKGTFSPESTKGHF